MTMLCLGKAEQEGRKVIMTGPRRRLLPGLDHKHRADQLTQLCLQPMELVGIGKCTLLQVNMAGEPLQFTLPVQPEHEQTYLATGERGWEATAIHSSSLA